MKVKILLGFMLAYGFRLAFGLMSHPTLTYVDCTQTYLIGLKSYTTQTWPYFGPDTEDPSEGTIKTQCPGALEGLLISASLHIWSNPIAPYILVNLLSLFSLGLLAWYCCKRLPHLSPWLVYTWIFICPWDTHISTDVFNLSFICVGSVLFLLGFMESIPELSLNIIPKNLANALMGFSIFWNMQFYLSWVLFVALSFSSFCLQWRAKKNSFFIIYFILGSLPTLSTVLPTFIQYGFQKSGDPSGFMSSFRLDHFANFFTILARFFSFSSFEMPRFLGEHTPQRIAFLLKAPWLLLPAVFLLIMGWLQVLAQLVLWFKKEHPQKDWKVIKTMTLGVVLLVWISFWFTFRSPDAHRFYSVFPFAMIYFFYCWDLLPKTSKWIIFSKVFIAIAVFFQIFYAIQNGVEGSSSYARDKDNIQKAIMAKDYTLLAQRRPYSLY